MNWLEDLQKLFPAGVVRSFGDDVLLFQAEEKAWILYTREAARGALGSQQVKDLLLACNACHASGIRNLMLVLDSSGADLNDPLPSLAGINTLLEALWALRQAGIEITAVIPNQAFGGAAVLLATCAHVVLLGPTARWGLLGSRILAQAPGTEAGFQEASFVHRLNTLSPDAVLQAISS